MQQQKSWTVEQTKSYISRKNGKKLHFQNFNSWHSQFPNAYLMFVKRKDDGTQR